MFNDSFDFLLDYFGSDIKVNDENKTRQAILSATNITSSLPSFDDYMISTNFQLKRGDKIHYDNTTYLILSDIQSERLYEYKALMRPMINELDITHKEGGYYEETDRFGNPIWIEEPTEVTESFPCIVQQEQSPSIEGGKIRLPEERIVVTMPDNDTSKNIKLDDKHDILNDTYKVVNINAFQKGLRIFTMKWTA